MSRRGTPPNTGQPFTAEGNPNFQQRRQNESFQLDDSVHTVREQDNTDEIVVEDANLNSTQNVHQEANPTDQNQQQQQTQDDQTNRTDNAQQQQHQQNDDQNNRTDNGQQQHQQQRHQQPQHQYQHQHHQNDDMDNPRNTANSDALNTRIRNSVFRPQFQHQHHQNDDQDNAQTNSAHQARTSTRHNQVWRPQTSYTPNRAWPPQSEDRHVDSDVHSRQHTRITSTRDQAIEDAENYIRDLRNPNLNRQFGLTRDHTFNPFRGDTGPLRRQNAMPFMGSRMRTPSPQRRRNRTPPTPPRQGDMGPPPTSRRRQYSPSPTRRPYTSTPPPNRNNRGDDSIGSLVEGLQNFRLSPSTIGPAPAPQPNLPPTYVPVEQQALQMHQRSIDETLQRANLMQQMMGLMMHSRGNTQTELSPEFENMARTMTEEIERNKRDAELKSEGMRRASKIVDYYKTPIQKPPILDPRETQRTFVNLRELIMVTGYFDPNDKESDFKHVWHKLLDYGQAQNYGESHYMTALGAILKKEAYETYSDFKQTDRTLTEILEYFAKVYTKKRTIGDAKMAVDSFTRKKGESLLACMDRTFLVVDKLRIHYEPAAWIHIRQQMRRHILMQVIEEKTKRHIQMEEDYITETTGMPYDFDNLIRKADSFERYNNAIPDRDIQTAFKVASGGLTYKPSGSNKSPEQQLQHLKKEQMMEKQIQTLHARLQQIEVNAVAPPRTFKFGDKPDKARESRSRERDQRVKDNRSSSFNRARKMEEEPPKSGLTDEDIQMFEAPPNKPPAAQKFIPPNPFKTQPKPDQQRFTAFRPQQVPQQRPDSRPPSRTQSGNRFPSRSPNRAATPFNQNRTRSPSADNRSQSRDNWQNRITSNKPQTTITTGGKVYISINGQEYVARPNYKQEN